MTARPLAVVALGGNALLPSRGAITMAGQRDRAIKAAAALSPLARTHRLVITHGRGTYSGGLDDSSGGDGVGGDGVGSGTTLDVIDAQIEGMLGYLLAQALGNAFGSDVVTLLTQVEVAATDPAFACPTKPVGPIASETRSAELRSIHGWTMLPVAGGWRRVVPSPLPVDIVELAAIRSLIAAGIVPICSGGGGIPVVRRDFELSGVEGVVDKDLTSSLLARRIGADLLVLLTDVEGLWMHWGQADAQLVRRAPAAWAQTLALESGSMAPKVQGCCEFAESTGKPAYIGSLNDAAAIVAGERGTQISTAITRSTFAG